MDAALRPRDVLPTAFDTRQALMPMWGATPLPPDAWNQRWAVAAAQSINTPALAYLHIPFCANRCVFCGFYRNAWREEHGPVYVDRLIAELEHEAASRPQGGRIDAVYFGGGTPTALSAQDLSRLIRAVRSNLPLSDDCEITIEGRISHFDDAKVEACLEAGANRFSIGIQTFDSPLRRRLGRQHGGEEAAAYMRHLAQYDAVVVADLIFGLPGQDDARWMRDVDIALSLGLDGLDVYAFNCYPSLPINRMIEKGALPAMSDLPTQARHYAWAVRRIEETGWTQLSNSHFGSPSGTERNRYNSAVKSGLDCLAFGSGAGGQRGGLSYQVQGELDAYLATPVQAKPLGFVAQASANKALFGALQGNLERGELPLALIAGNVAAQGFISDWAVRGLLECADGIARLTVGGRFWAPTMIRALALTLEPYPDAAIGRPGGGRPMHPHARPGGAPHGHGGHPPHGHPHSHTQAQGHPHVAQSSD
ncbi:MAG: heme anaerobic degradation radical SAM methyltransferase ChuW/HutW [Rhodocyclaceae bacterium]